MPSVRAAQWIEALLARQQEPPILEKKTGLPYGWAIWLRARPPLPRPGHAHEVVAVLLPRPAPVATGRLPALSTWQAMRRLAWQHWDPAPRDQRWMRWTSAFASLLLHVLFAVLLLWVALVRSPQQAAEGGEGGRVQVEFVGQGAQEGGGDSAGGGSNAGQRDVSATETAAAGEPSPSSQAQPAATEQAAASTPSPMSESQVADVAPQPPATQSAPTPPVQATEVVEATSAFVVPPVSVPSTEVSVLPREPVPTVRERPVQTVQAPRVVVPTMTLPVRTPTATPPRMEVREREVAARVQAPSTLRLPQATVTVPASPREVGPVREREIRPLTTAAVEVPSVPNRDPVVRPRPSNEPQVRERSIANAATASPMPSSASAPPASASTATSPSSSTRSSTSVAPSAAATAQAGARPSPTPGNWATAARGDDWGASNRDRAGDTAGAARAGQGAGVFNADGSVRVPGQDGAEGSGRGAPGGANDGWSRDRIAESGTWLKRPPYDYTPTSFDKYWVPNESLLAEWVRRGVKAIEIPIPGTSTKISCVVSVLQFGGGCGLSDPNMQEQPAVARPPPDIPFKKELQEDNGSR